MGAGDRQASRTGWLRQPPQCAIVSHGSAVRLYRVGDIPGSSAEFTIANQQPPISGVGLYTDTLTGDDWRGLDGLPVTRSGRTLADLAELSRLAAAFVRQGHAGSDNLVAALAGVTR